MKKNILITGATGGIGKATALQLAQKNCRITILGRNEIKLSALRTKIISETNNKDIFTLRCDLSSLDSIKKAAIKFKEDNTYLDVLINNAGVSPGVRQETVDGFEMNFGVNHLAPFLLTNLLLPLLEKGRNPRIVIVASAAYTMSNRDIDDLNWRNRPYKMMTTYSTSKLFNIYFMLELAERLKDKNITVNALHPGIVKSQLFSTATGIMGVLNKAIEMFYTTPEKGARTSVYLATSDKVKNVTGKYFANSKEKKITSKYLDAKFQNELWNKSNKFVGITGNIE